MNNKFYVPVKARIAEIAAKHFIQEVQEGKVNWERGVLNETMTLCSEIIMIAEHSREVTLTMTNTQAVWVYSTYDKFLAKP